MRKDSIFSLVTFSLSGISTIILVLSIATKFITMENLQQNATYWILAGMILPMVAWGSYKLAFQSHKNEISTDYLPFRDKDNRSSYTNHLKNDIATPILKQNITEIGHTRAIIRLPLEMKEMVLCHFYTAEKHTDHYTNLFTEYVEVMNFDRIMRFENVEIHEYLQSIKHWLWGIRIDNKDPNIEFFEDNLLSALNIEKEIQLLEIEHMQKTIDKIPHYNKVGIDQSEYPICYLTVNQKHVLKATLEIVKKYYNELEQKISKFNKMISDANFHMSTEAFMRLNTYDFILRSNFETIGKGEPIIGVCKGCVQYFAEKERRHYEKHINRFEKIKDSVFFPTGRPKK